MSTDHDALELAYERGRDEERTAVVAYLSTHAYPGLAERISQGIHLDKETP